MRKDNNLNLSLRCNVVCVRLFVPIRPLMEIEVLRYLLDSISQFRLVPCVVQVVGCDYE